VRIVGGSARGRTLATPKSDDVIRPTADRARETIFNVLGQRCDGLTVLDLYAGTGAFGLEALSRGAVKVVQVDKAREAIDLCRANAASLKFTSQVEIIAADVLLTIASLGKKGAKFELVFADPPYKHVAGVQVLKALLAAGIVTPEGVAVIETGRDEELPEREGDFERIDERELGAARVSIFRLTQRSA
jgi:16S rRNA (guanine966-N2)-methyltransferase